MKNNHFFYKLFHWEYWPSFLFYLPNIPLALYLAIKAKSPVFFSATNPAIKNSGNGMESKFDTLQLIPEALRPKSILVKPTESYVSIKKRIKDSYIEYPFIAKPDIGFRGLLVKKINTSEDLKNYLANYPINIIIQEFISLENECGIFYHRIPGKNSGVITSMTLKKYLTVTGDGKSSISELIQHDNRARIYHEILIPILNSKIDTVPKLEENVVLNVIGNHSKGTRFIDGNHLISKQLIQTIDTIKDQILGWNYGRIDLKFKSLKSLEKGEEFKILEINGIISEPTHIYDTSKNSYLDAIKSIADHWKILYRIATKNHFRYQISYSNTWEFIKEMKALILYTRIIKRLNL